MQTEPAHRRNRRGKRLDWGDRLLRFKRFRNRNLHLELKQLGLVVPDRVGTSSGTLGKLSAMAATTWAL